jgi:hypothetical protein
VEILGSSRAVVVDAAVAHSSLAGAVQSRWPAVDVNDEEEEVDDDDAEDAGPKT